MRAGRSGWSGCIEILGASCTACCCALWGSPNTSRSLRCPGLTTMPPKPSRRKGGLSEGRGGCIFTTLATSADPMASRSEEGRLIGSGRRRWMSGMTCLGLGRFHELHAGRLLGGAGGSEGVGRNAAAFRSGQLPQLQPDRRGPGSYHGIPPGHELPAPRPEGNGAQEPRHLVLHLGNPAP